MFPVPVKVLSVLYPEVVTEQAAGVAAGEPTKTIVTSPTEGCVLQVKVTVLPLLAFPVCGVPTTDIAILLF